MKPFPILLAFHFASPGVLAGLSLVAVPVLLHWLFRRPQREEPWAAITILRRAIARQSRRTRLQTLLLLAVRMLLIAAAVLAFARPTVDGIATIGSARTVQRRILIVDTSLSMGSRENGETPLEQSRRSIKRILEEGAPGDSHRVLSIAPRNVTPEVIRYSSSDAAAVLREIEGLPQTDSFGDPAPALAAALEWIDGATDSDWEVLVLSDFQEVNWKGDDRDGSRIADLLQTIARKAHLVLIPHGDRETGNAAIVNVERRERVILTGEPVHFGVTVESFAAQPRAGTTVEARVEGSVRAVARIDLPKEGRVTADLTIVVDSVGETVIEFVLSPDATPADDHAFHVVRGRDRLRVLIVDTPGGAGRLRSRDYVKLALDPRVNRSLGTSTPEPSRLHVDAIDAGDLMRQRLEDYDVVFLTGVPRLTSTEADRLDRWVSAGGGLIIGLSPSAVFENYNTLLFRGGEGLLPARLTGWSGTTGDTESAATFVLGDAPHPILDPFVGNPDSGLTTTRVWSFARVEDAGARAALSLSSGEPVILQRDFGRGRCLMSSVSLDDQGSNWTIWPSFVPLVQEMTSFAAAAADPQIVTAGQPLIFTGVEPDRARVRLPGGEIAFLSEPGDARPECTFADTRQAGIYSLAVDDPFSGIVTPGNADNPAERQTRLAAVNPDTSESRLRRLSADDVSGLLNGLPHVVTSDWTPRASAAGAGSSMSRDLSTPLLWGVLLLAVAEVVLTWRFALGVVLLAAILVGGVVRVLETLWW